MTRTRATFSLLLFDNLQMQLISEQNNWYLSDSLDEFQVLSLIKYFQNINLFVWEWKNSLIIHSSHYLSPNLTFYISFIYNLVSLTMCNYK